MRDIDFKMHKIVAVVPVRKGSQRVKNKNFRTFGGKNLLIHKIEILKKLKFLDEIIINTNSDKAISIAKKLNTKKLVVNVQKFIMKVLTLQKK